MDEDNKPVYITPPNPLKDKVGEGGIPAYLIKRCQEYLESNPVDYTPYAHRHLEQLLDIKAQIEKDQLDFNTARDKINNIVMQLKSNGSMFHYQLLSMLSDVMLRFLENVTHIDGDFVEIMNVYTKILNIILNKRLNGNAGKEGYALTQELNNACLRYYAKYNISR